MDEATLLQAIQNDPDNQAYTAQGIPPIYTLHSEAKIVIVGQAPGKKAQDTQLGWNDASGARLRNWLGISRETFYHSNKLAIVPMDFYYPGKARNGDLPPRQGFAAKWHPLCMALMPEVELVLLVGQYAQAFYLADKPKTVTETVAQYHAYLPYYWPLPHPSPLNNRWLKQNEWFEQEAVPHLQATVHHLLGSV